jgi:hypothetical protein
MKQIFCECNIILLLPFFLKIYLTRIVLCCHSGCDPNKEGEHGTDEVPEIYYYVHSYILHDINTKNVFYQQYQVLLPSGNSLPCYYIHASKRNCLKDFPC